LTISSGHEITNCLAARGKRSIDGGEGAAPVRIVHRAEVHADAGRRIREFAGHLLLANVFHEGTVGYVGVV
jgi:hypothetical protein